MSGNGNGKRPRLDEQGKSIRELELEIELARLRREEAAPGQEIVVLDEAGAAAAASAQIAQPAAQIAESGGPTASRSLGPTTTRRSGCTCTGSTTGSPSSSRNTWPIPPSTSGISVYSSSKTSTTATTRRSTATNTTPVAAFNTTSEQRSTGWSRRTRNAPPKTNKLNYRLCMLHPRRDLLPHLQFLRTLERILGPALSVNSVISAW